MSLKLSKPGLLVVPVLIFFVLTIAFAYGDEINDNVSSLLATSTTESSEPNIQDNQVVASTTIIDFIDHSNDNIATTTIATTTVENELATTTAEETTMPENIGNIPIPEDEYIYLPKIIIGGNHSCSFKRNIVHISRGDSVQLRGFLFFENDMRVHEFELPEKNTGIEWRILDKKNSGEHRENINLLLTVGPAVASDDYKEVFEYKEISESGDIFISSCSITLSVE